MKIAVFPPSFLEMEVGQGEPHPVKKTASLSLFSVGDFRDSLF